MKQNVFLNFVKSLILGRILHWAPNEMRIFRILDFIIHSRDFTDISHPFMLVIVTWITIGNFYGDKHLHVTFFVNALRNSPSSSPFHFRIDMKHRGGSINYKLAICLA